LGPFTTQAIIGRLRTMPRDRLQYINVTLNRFSGFVEKITHGLSN
jgi:hypothetical protein